MVKHPDLDVGKGYRRLQMGELLSNNDEALYYVQHIGGHHTATSLPFELNGIMRCWIKWPLNQHITTVGKSHVPFRRAVEESIIL